MRISEIISEAPLVKPTIDWEETNFPNLRDWEWDDKVSWDADRGSFSHGRPIGDPDHEHEYELDSTRPTDQKRDATYQYYSAIKGIMGSNRYVPTAYEIKILVDADRNIKPTYKTQRLVSWKEVTTHALANIAANELSQMTDLNPNELQSLKQFVTDGQAFLHVDYPTQDENNLRQSAFYALQKLMHVICEGKRTTRNKPLQQVGKIVSHLSKKYNYVVDLNMGEKNIMFRRVPWGFQPVINDPLAYLG